MHIRCAWIFIPPHPPFEKVGKYWFTSVRPFPQIFCQKISQQSCKLEKWNLVYRMMMTCCTTRLAGKYRWLEFLAVITALGNTPAVLNHSPVLPFIWIPLVCYTDVQWRELDLHWYCTSAWWPIRVHATSYQLLFENYEGMVQILLMSKVLFNTGFWDSRSILWCCSRP